MRRLYIILTVLSGVLCAAAVAMWVRSEGRADGYLWHNPNSDTWRYLGSQRGQIFIENGRVGFTGFESYPLAPETAEMPWETFRWNCPGIEYKSCEKASWSREGFWFIGVRFWLIASVFAITTGLFYRWLPGAIRPGHCRRCGYDLRATLAKCPECGATPNAKTSPPDGSN